MDGMFVSLQKPRNAIARSQEMLWTTKGVLDVPVSTRQQELALGSQIEEKYRALHSW